MIIIYHRYTANIACMYVNILFLVINYWPSILTGGLCMLQAVASLCDICAVFCIICFKNGNLNFFWGQLLNCVNTVR